MCQIANENGFQCESHQVTTHDGYLLNIWRVRQENLDKDAPPILLQHGLECDMMMWIFNEPSIAPLFVLARAGYDVWMGNNRGNRWSLGHKTLNKKEKAYWDFDWEDMGLKDTPAVIDFILHNTGHEKLSYAGHSEGTS